MNILIKTLLVIAVPYFFVVVCEKILFDNQGFYSNIESNAKLSTYVNDNYSVHLRKYEISKISSENCIVSCYTNVTYYSDKDGKLGGISDRFIAYDGNYKIEQF